MATVQQRLASISIANRAAGKCGCGRARRPGCRHCWSCYERHCERMVQKKREYSRAGLCHDCGVACEGYRCPKHNAQKNAQQVKRYAARLSLKKGKS